MEQLKELSSERKSLFIKEADISLGSKKQYIYILNKANAKEIEFEKEVLDFTKEELVDFIKSLELKHLKAAQTHKSIFQKYFKWGCLKGICDKVYLNELSLPELESLIKGTVKRTCI